MTGLAPTRSDPAGPQREGGVIRLTLDARRQIDLLRHSRDPSSGFLAGGEIGRYRVIARLCPLPFPDDRLAEALAAAVRTLGPRLVGVYFANRPVRVATWLVNDLVLSFTGATVEVFTLALESRMGEGRERLETRLVKICDL